MAALEALEYCELCAKFVPLANVTLHKFRCGYAAVPGQLAQLEHSNSEEWFDKVEADETNPTLQISATEVGHGKRPTNQGPTANGRLEAGSPAYSDCSDDWFDRVECSICPDCHELFTSNEMCVITKRPHPMCTNFVQDSSSQRPTKLCRLNFPP
eukprot:EG_transcript_25528